VIKQINDYLEIANNFFSESEITQLKSFPIEKALEGFYNCWTGKEAFIKLSGEGLSYPLKDFDVQIKEMKVDETNRYNILIKKNEEIFIVESFKLQDNLVGSCALRNKSYNTTYCFFENNVYSINSFITENLSSND
jgi:phosphopantetheine--protein transferase-like protein